MFDAWCRYEQLPHFLDTQYRWQFARIARQDQALRQVWAVERYREENAQRRDGTVNRGWLYPALALVNLKPTNILSGCCIGRLPQERCEAAHETNMLVLCIGPQAAHCHVFEHALPHTDVAVDSSNGIGSSSRDEGNSML
jgi:hypothetical protein